MKSPRFAASPSRNFWVKEEISMAKLKVTLTRSVIGRPQTQRKTVQSLGLGKMNSSSVLPDNEAIRGQLHKVRHLVTVEEVDE
jgi:large subunit ribosomal protein L30